MDTKAKGLLSVCLVLLLITSVAVGASYALFTDSVEVKNHLEAGTLDVTLKRTSLKYNYLSEEGYLIDATDGELDLTKATAKNVFGIDTADTKIVPGSYFDAKLAIGNNGNVAFDYSVEIKLATENEELANELAKQLQVTISDANGKVVAQYMLSDLHGTANCEVKAGHMKANESEHTFGVKVEFINHKDNNDAKSQIAEFDLYVKAVQATEQK